jgi:hypothetical protein
MPSHIQVARVLDGSLDAAIAWVPAAHGGLHLHTTRQPAAQLNDGIPGFAHVYAGLRDGTTDSG